LADSRSRVSAAFARAYAGSCPDASAEPICIPKPAITLSRKDWHSPANRAVLWQFRSTSAFRDPAPPAQWPRWGFGGGGAMPPEPEWRIPMPKTGNKRASKTVTARPVATRPSQLTKITSANDRKHESKRNSKQARVVAMLRSPTGTTIAAVMRATSWQQHSVRGFFAGVVQKKLRFKLDSKKIDGNRIYRIVDAGGGRSNPRRPSRQSA
jgi:Protein of unknown function (DUF3489)